AFVCTLVFARPALLTLAGAPWAAPRALMLPAAFAKSKKHGRREYLRARLDDEGRVEVFRSEGSGRVSGLAWAEGLVELPDPEGTIAPGDPVRYLPFTAFGLLTWSPAVRRPGPRASGPRASSPRSRASRRRR